MDGLSAAASVVALTQISAQVFDLCRKYYTEVKEARKEIQRLRDEITSLQDVLTNVVDLDDASNPIKLSVLDRLNRADGPVQQCQSQLTGLVARLDPGDGPNRMRHFGLRALKWPFDTKDVDKVITAIERHKATFNLALTADLARLSQAIQGNVTSLNESMEELKIGQQASLKDRQQGKIFRWLSSPDPSSNHNSARKKQQPKTGAWFLDGSQFDQWRTNPNSFLWLHGIPGCGKTILCSAIIHDVVHYCQSHGAFAIGYFYFDFSDPEKQRHENLVRSLIVQFSSRASKVPEALETLYSQNKDGQTQPSTDALIAVLEIIFQAFDQSFIIIDALDECSDRQELLSFINGIIDWKVGKLHILATSRKETDISEVLDPLITEQISIQNDLVNADIRLYIQERLRNDRKLKKWPEKIRMEIETTLMDGAHGMFRWVVCQVDEVRKCLKPKELQKALKSLPRTLDDTYARILCNIDEQHSADVFKILQWLVYSTRPMAIEEIAEVVAIDTEEDCRLDLENRLREPHDILTICSSLVTTTRSTVMEGHERYREIEELKLAHFSVKEYLISDRMRNTKASRYSLTDYSAHDYIARTCLVYLLHFDEPTSLTLDNIHEFPLVEYAARYWTQHVKEVEKETHEYKAQELCMKLLSLQHTAYFIWLRLLYSSKPWEEYCTIAVPESVLPPLYFSSLNGLIVSTKMLLEAGADVNTQAGEYDNALQADVNVQDEAYGNALQAASSRGHETVVRLLLDAGANVNAQGELYGNALQAASNEGHETVVRLLLDAGVNVNAQGGKYGNALQAASAKRHEAAIRLLLDAEANVNAQGGKCDTALQATIVERGKSVSHEKYEAVIQLLLKAEAKVNAENEEQENRAFNHLSLEA